MLRSPHAQPDGTEREHRPARITLLREIKVDSPVHRLWAGTKLVAVAALSIVLSYFPSWGSIGLVTCLLLAGAWIAHIPRGAWPRPPGWFWIVMAVSAGLASLAGHSPHVVVGGVRLGLGGVDAYFRFVAIGVALLLGAALVGWTTPLGEIAPAVSRLLAPLRLLRVPVDEAAVAVALCVRSLPLLVDELRTLVAARRLRPAPPRPGRSTLQRWLDEPVDLMVAALAVAMRRAGELAEAITARGGTGLVAARVGRPRMGDAVTLLVVAGVCAGATMVPVP
ncbi:MAG TPA: energy-coupling factor transporter transmembrane protein EcfT [Acidimicrobiales bacterium]